MTRFFVVRHRMPKTSAGSSWRIDLRRSADSVGLQSEGPSVSACPSCPRLTEYRSVSSRSRVPFVCMMFLPACACRGSFAHEEPGTHSEGMSAASAGEGATCCSGRDRRQPGAAPKAFTAAKGRPVAKRRRTAQGGACR